MSTTNNDHQLDELIANLDTIATQHAEAVTALADLDQRLDNGDPTATRQAVRDATDEKEHQAKLLAGARRRLDQHLTTLPAGEPTVELEAAQEAARAEARARLADTRVELAASEKAVQKAQKALDKANEKHAEITASLAEQAHGVGGINVELAEAFARFTRDLSAGPTTIGHKAMQAPATHEAPMVHIVQARATEHHSITHNIGIRSVTHAGKARGALTATYHTRPGFTAPSDDEIEAQLGTVGWKIHVDETTTASTDGRLTSTQHTITVSDGHVLAPIVDPGIDCGAPNSRYVLDHIILGQHVDEDGVTTTRAGVRLARPMKCTRLIPGHPAMLDTLDRELAEKGLPTAIDGLVAKLGWKGCIRAAEQIKGTPSWAGQLPERKLHGDWADAATGYAVITMTSRETQA